MKKTPLLLLLMAIFLLSLAGCAGSNAPTTEVSPATSSSDPAATLSEDDSLLAELTSHTLSIYCGAGMTKPFGEIADAFKAATGCEMEVTYGNAAQTQTQINTAQEGDLFIAGSADEVKPVSDVVTASVDLVKHIPVLAVKAGNPLGINGLADLAKENVRLVLGDAQSTPIGKIANKALGELGILEQVNVISRTTTAPATFNALAMDECDAIIVWKENVTGDDVMIVDTPDLDDYIKTIPAASLSYCDDSEALSAFLDFLNTDGAKNIWSKYGYEALN